MKNYVLALLMLAISSVRAQQANFNKTLADFCAEALSQTNSIAAERKILLDSLAEEMTNKRYLMFLIIE